MASLNLKSAERARNEITRKQQKQIKKLYSDVRREVAQRAEFFKARDNISSVMRAEYLGQMEQAIGQSIQRVGFEVETMVTENMKTMSSEVARSSAKFIASIGIDTRSPYFYVPEDVVRSIATGQVYDGGWNLSKSIWSMNDKAMTDLHSVIAKGVAMNKSTYDISKDIELYVNPSVRKDWSWSKVYPGTNKVVDFSAQRLARTLVQHAYQQSFVDTTYYNPFITKYRWLSAQIHGRTCQLCIDMHDTLFDKDKLPFDHPMGLCTVVAEITASRDEITDRISDWYKAPKGTYADLDLFSVSMKRNVKEEQLITTSINK